MKVRNARRTLITSTIAVIVCFAMLIGTTFAWLTDTHMSGINTIQSGNLDVGFVYTDASGQATEVTENTALFKNVDGEDILWEPGAKAYGEFEIANNGMVALKYEFKPIFANATKTPDDKTLAEVLTVDVVVTNKGSGTDDVMEDARLEALVVGESIYATTSTPKLADDRALEGYLLAGESITYKVTLQWLPSATDNDFNVEGGLTIDLAVALVATQVSHEKDGDGFTYDMESELPEYPEIPTVVKSGVSSGVNFTLTSDGTMTVSPSAATVPDANCGKTFAPGTWREAVVYNSNGGAKKVGGANDAPNAGGLICDPNAVTSLVIEEGVTSIGAFAAKFPNLTGEVVIPASVTYIGQEAFQNCPITKLTFKEGGTEELCIAPGVFKNLAIEELVLPADRPAIHLHCWAFNDCVKLKRVTLPANITTFSGWTHVEYCGMSYVNGYDSQIFARCWALESITFGNQTVHDLFFSAPGNTGNINAIGGVEIIVEN